MAGSTAATSVVWMAAMSVDSTAESSEAMLADQSVVATAATSVGQSVGCLGNLTVGRWGDQLASRKVGDLAVSLVASMVDWMVNLWVLYSVDTMAERTDMTSAGKLVEMRANTWDNA